MNKVERCEEEVEVTLTDGYKLRFFVLGLTDSEYISRAKQIRKMESLG